MSDDTQTFTLEELEAEIDATQKFIKRTERRIKTLTNDRERAQMQVDSSVDALRGMAGAPIVSIRGHQGVRKSLDEGLVAIIECKKELETEAEALQRAKDTIPKIQTAIDAIKAYSKKNAATLTRIHNK